MPACLEQESAGPPPLLQGGGDGVEPALSSDSGGNLPVCGVGDSSGIEDACDLSAHEPSLVSAAERDWYNGFSDANCEEEASSVQEAASSSNSNNWSVIADNRVSSDGVEGNNHNISRAVAAAFDSAGLNQELELSWEQGVFGAIFGSSAQQSWLKIFAPDARRPVQPSDMLDPNQILEENAALGRRVDRGHVLYKVAVRSAPDISWET